MFTLGFTADLVDVNDRMSGPPNGYTKSPHGAIGDTVPQYSTIEQQLDLGMNGLSLHPGPDDAANGSRISRDTDLFSRAPGPSIWAKSDSTAEPGGGWDKAAPRHFASRPQSPQKATLLAVPAEIGGAPPKSAPLPAYAPFNPVITPPAPAVSLPPPSQSVSPSQPPSQQQPTSLKGKEVMSEASRLLEQLQSLLGPLVTQAEEVAKLKAEIIMWKNSAEAAVQEVVRLEGEVSSQGSAPHTTAKSDDGFIAVLIDGDSLVFHEDHVKAGPQGGQAAAHALIKAIRKLDGGAESKLPAVMQVFFNKNALGNALIKAGLVASWALYEGFWQGFSAQHGLISVIDVGTAKNASQGKVKEHIKLYSKNQQCQSIVVGSDKPLNMDEVSDKVILLKASVNSDDSASTEGTAVHTLPEIFRSTPIPTAPMSFSSVVSSVPQTPHAVKPEDLEVEVYEWEELPKDNLDEWTEAKKKGHGGKKAATAAGVAGESSKKPGQAFNKGNGNGKDKDKKFAGGKQRGNNGNNGHKGRGVGVRDIKPRPCHSHYLSPAGCRNDNCHYGHEHDLDDDQLNELAILAKQIPCPYARTRRCHFDDETCIYGHKCPRGSDCSFDECRFDEIDPDHQVWQ